MTSPRDWKTTEMIRAERDLDNSIEDAVAQFDRIDRNLAWLDDADEPMTDEEVDSFRQFVTGPGLTAQWRWVAQRIAEGSFTWRDVIEGGARSDPDVVAAWDSMASVRVQSLSEPGPAGQTPAQQPRRAATDEEYFEDYSVFRKDLL
ncbi:hypothetical protein [Actinokineospora sp.]|uniref:hypothetical protein n=1 Tax=Actinokineospora sp. TaxID=1872133 RepID=UPI004037EB8E